MTGALRKKLLDLAIRGHLTASWRKELEWEGELPSGWKMVKGKDLLEETESRLPFGEMFDYIDIDSIDNKQHVVVEPKHISVKNAPSRASRGLKAGDTLFSIVRPYLENIAYIDESLENCIASTGFFVCRPKALCDSRYLYLLMTTPYVINGLNKFMKGDNSPSIRKSDILRFEFPLPPLEEQKAIVKRLEELLALEKKIAADTAALDELASAAKRKILDLAIRGKLVPRMGEWKTVKLGEIIDLISGTSYDKNDVVLEGIRILRGGNIHHDNTITREVDDVFLPEQYHDNEKSPLQSDIVIVASTGSAAVIGRAGLPTSNMLDCQIGAFLRIVRPKQIEYADYIKLIFQSDIYKRHIEEQAKGTNIKNIKAKYILDFEIPLPPLAEQKVIVAKVEELLAAIKGLNAK